MTLVLAPDAQVVATAKLAAARGTFDGRVTAAAQGYLRACNHWDPRSGTQLIYTRDVGHHTSGWFKNPDYERCLHLSLSFTEPGRPAARRPRDVRLSVAWGRAFWGEAFRWSWGEPPVSPSAQALEVWHYRLFCDVHWQPIKPRGEVYSRELTERGWRSASELGAPEPFSPLYPG